MRYRENVAISNKTPEKDEAPGNQPEASNRVITRVREESKEEPEASDNPLIDTIRATVGKARVQRHLKNYGKKEPTLRPITS